MRADGDYIPLTGTFLHNCPMSDMLIDEFDSEILSCRCFYSREFFDAQDVRAVALDALRVPKQHSAQAKAHEHHEGFSPLHDKRL